MVSPCITVMAKSKKDETVNLFFDEKTPQQKPNV